MRELGLRGQREPGGEITQPRLRPLTHGRSGRSGSRCTTGWRVQTAERVGRKEGRKEGAREEMHLEGNPISSFCLNVWVFVEGAFHIGRPNRKRKRVKKYPETVDKQ